MEHRVVHVTLNMADRSTVLIKYWAEGDKIHMAGFRPDGKQVTAVTYTASVDLADESYSKIRQSLIETLADAIQNDLLSNPSIHYRP